MVAIVTVECDSFSELDTINPVVPPVSNLWYFTRHSCEEEKLEKKINEVVTNVLVACLMKGIPVQRVNGEALSRLLMKEGLCVQFSVRLSNDNGLYLFSWAGQPSLMQYRQ